MNLVDRQTDKPTTVKTSPRSLAEVIVTLLSLCVSYDDTVTLLHCHIAVTVCHDTVTLLSLCVMTLSHYFTVTLLSLCIDMQCCDCVDL